MSKRVLIVGGVAAGASCAARLRRIAEEAEIVLYERGTYVSFANCGLPYHVGDIIPKESALLLASPELFKARFNIEVRTEHEVTSINRASRTIEVKDLRAGITFEDSYDELVLAPGAAPIRPPLPGIDLPGIFTLRTIPDSREVRAWIDDRRAPRQRCWRRSGGTGDRRKPGPSRVTGDRGGNVGSGAVSTRSRDDAACERTPDEERCNASPG